jgi:hypothetical protein
MNEQQVEDRNARWKRIEHCERPASPTQETP